MDTSKLIEKGFNAGYWIAQYLPSLSETLVKGISTSEHPYVQGFIGGTKEYLIERLEGKKGLNQDQSNESDLGLDLYLEYIKNVFLIILIHWSSRIEYQ